MYQLIAEFVLIALGFGLFVVLIWTALVRSAIAIGRNLTKPWNMNEPNSK